MANLGIVSYESFFSFIDRNAETDRSSRSLNVTYDKSYGQIFQAQSSEVENIFFMANVDSTTAAYLNITIMSLSGEKAMDVFTSAGLHTYCSNWPALT